MLAAQHFVVVEVRALLAAIKHAIVLLRLLASVLLFGHMIDVWGLGV
jgi:hypothetical protein